LDAYRKRGKLKEGRRGKNGPEIPQSFWDEGGGKNEKGWGGGSWGEGGVYVIEVRKKKQKNLGFLGP